VIGDALAGASSSGNAYDDTYREENFGRLQGLANSSDGDYCVPPSQVQLFGPGRAQLPAWWSNDPGAPADAGPPAPRTYTVQKGDNPATIGRMFYGDERAGAAIMATSGLSASVNGARNWQIGQVLTLPDSISDADLSAGGRLIGMDSAARAQEAAGPQGQALRALRVAQRP